MPDKKVLNWWGSGKEKLQFLKKQKPPLVLQKHPLLALGIDKPKRTITKYYIDEASKSRPESFDEYAKKLGVAFSEKQRKGTRVRVAKEGPKPKRMLRIDCEGN